MLKPLRAVFVKVANLEVLPKMLVLSLNNYSSNLSLHYDKSCWFQIVFLCKVMDV